MIIYLIYFYIVSIYIRTYACILYAHMICNDNNTAMMMMIIIIAVPTTAIMIGLQDPKA